MSGATAGEAPQAPNEHLLCDACTTLLAADDGYVADLAYRDGAAAILDELGHIESASEGVTSLCTLRASVDRQRICRFASSVLWLAHISQRVPECDVGERYAADLRAYLRRKSLFPDHLYLVLVVHLPALDGSNVLASQSHAPRSSRQRGYYSHMFANRGLQFVFTAGRESPEPQRVLCLHCGRQPYFLATGEDNARGGMQDRAEGVKPTRKLARWLMIGGG